MSRLLLIRHGQASFGADDYDCLSPVGEHQARVAGQYLADLGDTFDVVICGEMLRQRETARLATAAWADAPPVRVDSAFNEYDAGTLFDAYLPRVLHENPTLAEQADQLRTEPRVFMRLLTRITHHWIADTPHELGSCERWDEFVARVTAGLARLHDDYDSSTRIAVFTSGGPIAAAVAVSMGASAEHTLQLSRTIYNASVSELRSTRTGWRLQGFNDIGYLRRANGDDALVTLL